LPKNQIFKCLYIHSSNLKHFILGLVDLAKELIVSYIYGSFRYIGISKSEFVTNMSFCKVHNNLLLWGLCRHLNYREFNFFLKSCEIQYISIFKMFSGLLTPIEKQRPGDTSKSFCGLKNQHEMLIIFTISLRYGLSRR